MKKFLAMLILIATLVSLVACGSDEETYDPVESTEEEATVVMTLTVGDSSYDVKYELYRAFFLTYKSEVDGGNPDVWTGPDKDAYIEEIDAKIIDRIIEIYAAFAMCEEIDFDIYSDDVEDKIKENIKTSVEGGSYGSTTIEGYDSYDDYLEALKEMNLNYSVQTLLFRYAIAVDAIDTHYIGTVSSDDIDSDMSVGAIEYDKNDVRDFYFSDECVRVLRLSFQKGISYTPEEKAYSMKEKLEAAAATGATLEEKENKVFTAIMGQGLYSNAAEVKSGYVIGRYNLERSYYGEMTDAAFSISEGEVSDPVNVVTDVEDSYYVLYRSYKSDEHFEENYESIKYIYLMNYVGEILHGVSEELKASVTYTDFLNELDHSQIGM